MNFRSAMPFSLGRKIWINRALELAIGLSKWRVHGSSLFERS
jgi:hypothetical protein